MCFLIVFESNVQGFCHQKEQAFLVDISIIYLIYGSELLVQTNSVKEEIQVVNIFSSQYSLWTWKYEMKDTVGCMGCIIYCISNID